MAGTPMAEEQRREPAPSSSTLRWRILRQALRRRPEVADEQSETISTIRVSRKAKIGFDLIPCLKSASSDDENPHLNLGGPKDVCFRYTLPIHGAPELLLWKLSCQLEAEILPYIWENAIKFTKLSGLHLLRPDSLINQAP